MTVQDSELHWQAEADVFTSPSRCNDDDKLWRHTSSHPMLELSSKQCAALKLLYSVWH